MSTAELLVADAGPLIALARIDALGLLARKNLKVLVPAQVAAECTSQTDRPGADLIQKAIDQGVLQVISPVKDDERVITPGLDEGERTAITLALARQAVLLIDDRIGRRQAVALGLTVIGTLGILLSAKRRGEVHAIAPMLGQFHAVGYFISPALAERALELAGLAREHSGVKPE